MNENYGNQSISDIEAFLSSQPSKDLAEFCFDTYSKLRNLELTCRDIRKERDRLLNTSEQEFIIKDLKVDREELYNKLESVIADFKKVTHEKEALCESLSQSFMTIQQLTSKTKDLEEQLKTLETRFQMKQSKRSKPKAKATTLPI